MKTLPLGCSAPLRSAGALVVARRGSAIAAGLLVTLAVQASVPALETVSATPVTYAAAPGLVIPRTTEYLLDNAAVGNGQTKVRAGLVADLFCANARFILDTLVNNGGQWAFQTNPNGGTFPTNFRFALHMMNNAYGLPSGELCPVGFPIQVAQPTCGFEQV